MYALEYSPVQNCFHIDSVDSVIKNNFRAALEGFCAHYNVIALFETQDAACDYANKLEKVYPHLNKGVMHTQ